MSDRRRWRFALAILFLAPAWLVAQAAHAQGAVAKAADAAEAAAPPVNSALDDRLLYQLLIGEMALAQGDAGTAYDWLLDAARRTRDEGLFRRVVDIALQARAGEQALAATRAWRQAHPESLDALRMQLQVLLLLNRPDGVAEPLKALLALTPAGERLGVIAALPHFVQRAGEPARLAGILEEAFKPYRDQAGTRVAVRVALGRAWLEAHDADRALALALEARALDATAPGPVLLAMELMRDRPQAEALVLDHLARAGADPALRLTYVRVLTGAQRYADAVVQLETATREQPGFAQPWLSLGALYLELKQSREAEAALLRYVDLAQHQPTPAPAAPTAPAAASAGDDEEAGARPDEGLIQAWLMLAQLAELRSDYRAAEAWLARIEDPQRALEVQSRRASMLAQQGKLEQARELIRRVPERRTEDARDKLAAEAALLREAKDWRGAFDLLANASARYPQDADLIYEQAMMAEKLDQLGEMERLLRRVIELKPDNAHAHNALGYSLADRRLRLPEARQLVQRALELAPGDPFIIDSLGWIEFRLGNGAEALRLLKQAYAARPDTEIGAHLGEVLWSLGQRDEARRVWRESKSRDTANDVLRETLTRLRVSL
jgi:Flp pilus assembly protein TadD